MSHKVFPLLLLISLLCTFHSNAGVTNHYYDSIANLVLHASGNIQQADLLLKATKKLESVDPDKALEFATRAMALVDNSKSPELRLEAMLAVSKIQTIKTQFTPGMSLALKAKELATRLDNKKALGEACMIIGMIRIFQGNYTESYESYFTALRLFEEKNDQEGIVLALNGIGNICYYQQNYTKAFIYYDNALKKARDLKDTLQIANVLNNVGLVLVEQGQNEKGIKCYKEAIEINSRMDQKIRLATNYTNLGWAYFNLKRPEEFVVNCNKAITIYSEIGSIYSLAICYLDFSDYYNQLNDQEKRYKYAWLAYSQGVDYKLREVEFLAASSLHDFYFSNGKIDSAYKYAMIQNAEKDSINNEHSSAKLTLLEMEYNYDKKVKEESLKQQRKDFITIILVILAISGLVTTALALSRQIVKTKNIRLEKQRLTDEVEYKNKELAINVMNLLKKNEFLVEHTNRLIEIQQKATEESTKNDILHLISNLQRGSGNEIWDEFEVRFKQVHSGFYEKLLSSYPELSSNELKLCALLRLNLSTKEICELTGQRPASLDVARSRLRKKLGLTSSQINLITFLAQF